MNKRYMPLQERAMDFFKDYLNGGINFGNNQSGIEHFSREDIIMIAWNQPAIFKGYDKPVPRARVFRDLYNENQETIDSMCSYNCMTHQCRGHYECNLKEEDAKLLLRKMDDLFISTVASYKPLDK